MIDTKNIIITTNEQKNILLKQQVENKIYTVDEFIDNITFKYDEETIFYMMDNYNYNYDVCKKYLENMKYIDKKYNNKKIDELYDLKEELYVNNKIKINKLFINKIKNKSICFYNVADSLKKDFLKKRISNYEDVLTKHDDYKHKIYEFDSIENEVQYIANEIVDLFKKNVKASKIFLANVNDEYIKYINMIFPLYKIPYKIESNNLYDYLKVKKYLEHYLENDFLAANDIIKNLNEEESKIINKLISELNKFSFCEDKKKIKKMIINKLKNTKVDLSENENVVKKININDYCASDDEYIFLLGFNQNHFPIIKKDEDYFSDIEKNMLGIKTIDQENKDSLINAVNSIKKNKNLRITYKKNCEKKEYKISSVNEILKYDVIYFEYPKYKYKTIFNKLKYAECLDNYYKYKTITNEFNELDNLYSDNINYKKYDNKYKKIDSTKFKNYVDSKLRLSYSAINNYYYCAFKYYLSNILKLDIYEETFMQKIGIIFHEMLKRYKDEENFSKNFDELKNKYEFKEDELFFLEQIKNEIKNVIEIINKQNEKSMLDDELYEEKISFDILKNDYKITYTGIIDKLKYKNINGNKVVSIIDYKTGTPSIDIWKNYYGLEMQLPSYIYLLNNTEEFKNSKIAGIYLQKVINNDISYDANKDYQKEKEKLYKLIGYSNYDENILKLFDESYKDSTVIKSMKLNNDGSFNVYAKTMTNNQFESLSKNVENKVDEVIRKITNVDFSINPKRVDNVLESCKKCKFKDICFVQEKDEVNLEKKTLGDLIGGQDGLD